jgi:hypothetical protein
MFARLLACWPFVTRRRMRLAVEEWRTFGDAMYDLRNEADRRADDALARLLDAVSDAAELRDDRDRFRAACEDLAGYLYRAIQAGDRAVELAEAADLAVGHWQDTAAELDKKRRKLQGDYFAMRTRALNAEAKLRRIRLAVGTN